MNECFLSLSRDTILHATRDDKKTSDTCATDEHDTHSVCRNVCNVLRGVMKDENRKKMLLDKRNTMCYFQPHHKIFYICPLPNKNASNLFHSWLCGNIKQIFVEEVLEKGGQGNRKMSKCCVNLRPESLSLTLSLNLKFFEEYGDPVPRVPPCKPLPTDKYSKKNFDNTTSTWVYVCDCVYVCAVSVSVPIMPVSVPACLSSISSASPVLVETRLAKNKRVRRVSFNSVSQTRVYSAGDEEEEESVQDTEEIESSEQLSAKRQALDNGICIFTCKKEYIEMIVIGRKDKKYFCKKADTCVGKALILRANLGRSSMVVVLGARMENFQPTAIDYECGYTTTRHHTYPIQQMYR